MESTRDLTVLIIDEHSDISPLLAARLSLIRGIRVIGETANVMLGAELAHQLKPDVILADFRRTGPPRVQIVAGGDFLFGNGEGHALREAGVACCLLKGASVKKLAEQIIELARPGNGGSSKNCRLITGSPA